MKKSIVLISILGLIVQPVYAQTITYLKSGAIVYSWEDADNWSPATVPGASDTVVDSAEGRVRINANVTVDYIDFTNNSLIFLNNGADLTVNNNITTLGSLNFEADQTVIVNGSANIGILSAGTDSEGTVVFNDNATITNKIGSSSKYIKQVYFNGNTNLVQGATYADNLVLSDGTHTFQDSIVSSGAVSNAGSIIINISQSRSLDAEISGAGSLTKQGAGTLSIKGDNSYTGDTTISAGTISIIDSGDIDGDFIFDGGGTLQIQNGMDFQAGQTITGNGMLNINANTTIAEDVGTSLQGLMRIFSSGENVNFEKNVYIEEDMIGLGILYGTVNLQGDLSGKISFFAEANAAVNVSDGVTISGTVGGFVPSATGIGIVNLLGSYTVQQVLGVSTTYLAELNFGSASTKSTGTVTLDKDYAIYADDLNSYGAIIELGTNKVDVYGDITNITTQDTGTTIKTTISGIDAGEWGYFDLTGTATTSTEDIIDINLTASSLVEGSEIVLYDGGAAAAGSVPGTIIDNSSAYSFTVKMVGNDIILVVGSGGGGTITGVTGNEKNVANALESASGMSVVFNEVAGLSQAQQERALDQMTPNISYGLQESARGVSQNVAKVISGRFANRGIRFAGATGVSTGDEKEGSNSVWVKGYVGYDKQKERAGIKGYSDINVGTIAGYDITSEEDDLVMGIMGGWGYANVNYAQYNNNDTNINTALCGVYGEWVKDNLYVDMLFNVGFNFYKGSRSIQFGSTDVTADQEYIGQQYVIVGEAGYDIFIKGLRVTPKTGINWLCLHTGSYTEKNAGNLNLHVNKQNYNVLELGCGVEVAHKIQGKGYSFEPSFSLMWYYDTMADKAATGSTFAGGGTAFATNGVKPAQSRFDIGVGMNVHNDNGIELDLGYDVNLKDQYFGHYGEVTVTYKW